MATKASTPRIPAPSRRVQEANKSTWNERRKRSASHFFTIGYSGRDIEDFIAALRSEDVRLLIDARANPVSQYKPDFSKKNLATHLSESGISYYHAVHLGVPRDIRTRSIGYSRDAIWEWYDKHVLSSAAVGILNMIQHLMQLFTAQRFSFMCTELDPTACHRHRLALALEGQGLKSYDL